MPLKNFLAHAGPDDPVQNAAQLIVVRSVDLHTIDCPRVKANGDCSRLHRLLGNHGGGKQITAFARGIRDGARQFLQFRSIRLLAQKWLDDGGKDVTWHFASAFDVDGADEQAAGIGQNSWQCCLHCTRQRNRASVRRNRLIADVAAQRRPSIARTGLGERRRGKQQSWKQADMAKHVEQ